MIKTKIDLDKMEKKCICRGCPSFVECAEKTLFCLIGKSKCIREGKGCVCGGCPVKSELGLKKGYYCLSGKDPIA
jgi:hypothetical protein